MTDNDFAERAEQRAIDEWEAEKEQQMKDSQPLDGVWYLSNAPRYHHILLWQKSLAEPQDVPVRIIPMTLEERTRLHVLFTTLLTGMQDTIEGRARAATLILDSLKISAQPRITNPAQEEMTFTNEVAA
jgi:hypothetical protein